MSVMSEIQLKRLSEHKYSASCTSLLDPVFQIWWRWLVEQMPLWLAPNLLTLMGFLANFVPNLILIYYCPQATGAVSIELFASNAVVCIHLDFNVVTLPTCCWRAREYLYSSIFCFQKTLRQLYIALIKFNVWSDIRSQSRRIFSENFILRDTFHHLVRY